MEKLETGVCAWLPMIPTFESRWTFATQMYREQRSHQVSQISEVVKLTFSFSHFHATNIALNLQ